MSYTYSVDALVAANTAFRDLVDAQTGSASIVLTDDAGTVLGTVTLASPSASVDGATGQLAFSDDGTSHTAIADGTAVWAEIMDGAGVAHLTLPAVQDVTGLSGFCVINTITITNGAPIVLQSLLVG